MKESTARTVLTTSIALLVLWAASWGLSSFELGGWSVIIALAIAVVKASLVVIFFMELLHHRASIRLTAAAALVMVALLVGIVAMDVVARGVH